jgi:hypothetical protein
MSRGISGPIADFAGQVNRRSEFGGLQCCLMMGCLMFKFLLLLCCLCALLALGGCRLHHAARGHGYAAIKAKMSAREVADALGLPGTGNPGKQHCGKCEVWTCAGYYIKGYAETGEDVVQRFSIFANDGQVIADIAKQPVDPRLQRLQAPMRFAAVNSLLGSKGAARTLLAYTWVIGEGQVTVDFENGKAYHKQLVKAGGGQEALDLCPTSPLWDAPPAKE